MVSSGKSFTGSCSSNNRPSNNRPSNNRLSNNRLPVDGDVAYFPAFFSPTQSRIFFETLQSEVAWKHEPITMFGKRVMQPRLTAWYGDDDKPYRYSGLTMTPQRWSPAVLAIKAQIEPLSGVSFTGALLNLYRDGADSMGWHQDDEKELGANPVIGSVSLGVARDMQFRHVRDKKLKCSLELGDGSFLLMRGETQHHWQHAIPKRAAVNGPRINLTFRVILDTLRK